jgi:hypothetical protein
MALFCGRISAPPAYTTVFGMHHELMVKSGQKWSKVVKSGQKWSKVVKSGPKGCFACIANNNLLYIIPPRVVRRGRYDSMPLYIHIYYLKMLSLYNILYIYIICIYTYIYVERDLCSVHTIFV